MQIMVRPKKIPREGDPLVFLYNNTEMTDRDGALFFLNKRAEDAGCGRPFTPENLNNLVNFQRISTVWLEQERVYTLKVLRDIELETILPAGTHTAFSPDMRERARQMFAEEHLTVNEIAQRLSTPENPVPRTTINNWLSGERNT